MSVMKVTDQRKGDFRVSWDVADTSEEGVAQLENARKTFEDTIGLNFKAYRISRNTGRPIGEPITEFDELAEELLLLPPSAGGS